MALAKEGTHGKRFKKTGGTHLTADDFFKSMEIGGREDAIKKATDKKKAWLDHAKAEEEAKIVLAGQADGKFADKELAKLLAWHVVPNDKNDRKRHQEDKWKAIVELNQAPPNVPAWTIADESNLV